MYREIGRISLHAPDFDELDFSDFSFSTNTEQDVIADDSRRGWVKKEICLVSDGAESPFGVYSISYRYKVKGNIKNIT